MWGKTTWAVAAVLALAGSLSRDRTASLVTSIQTICLVRFFRGLGFGFGLAGAFRSLLFFVVEAAVLV